MRNHAEFYVWAENGKGQEFYIDFNGKEYIPKN